MKAHNNETAYRESARVELFSDGVFAIAITLLVLELIQILHPATGEDLITTCLHHWQSFLAFVIGFTTILICWINHHLAFEYIYRIDTNFMWINGFLLFVVTLTPFPTAVLAEYLQSDSKTALAFFGFNYILISVAANSICSYAYNHHLIAEEDRPYYNSYRLIYRYSIYYTVFAFILCFIAPWISLGLYILLFIFFAAPKKLTSNLENLRTWNSNRLAAKKDKTRKR